MLKHTLYAALSLAVVMIAIPAATGPALAQSRPCTAGAGCNPPPGSGGGESTYQCSSELGYLRRVHEDELDMVEDAARVSIVPICEGESYGVMRNDGNAGVLRGVIAGNEALMAALDLRAYEPEDVVGVRMTGDESVILYVHQFHHR